MQFTYFGPYPGLKKIETLCKGGSAGETAGWVLKGQMEGGACQALAFIASV